jgi:uncharacterized protein YndB with AHSA1/START domain
MTAALGTLVGGDAVRFERLLPGPIDRVWSYLTDSERLPLWFIPGSVAPAVGGAVSFDMGMGGLVTAYDPPHVLEYTWNEPNRERGPVLDALVRWELATEGDQVRLVLLHRRLPTATRPQFGAGWHTLLDRLEANLQEREAPEIWSTFAALEPAYAERFAS